MLFREISHFLGRYLFYFSLILCIPLIVALFFEFLCEASTHPQAHSTFAFAKTVGISLFLAALFLYFGRRSSGNFQRRESILIVALVWLLTPWISSLPFIFTHTLDHPIDAYFEAMSGLTTTGASVIHTKVYDPTGQEKLLSIQSRTDPQMTYRFYGTVSPVRDSQTGELYTGVEAVGKALLFWRSFLQWIGGMGIIVLFITILPALSMGGRFLFEAEVPGPSKEGMTPRIKETASLLWRIYLGLTAFQVFLLMVTNPCISLFDAINLSFSTISTGGFTIRNAGLADYHSLSTEWIVVIFMVLGSLNFTLYFHCMRGKIYRVYEPEFFAFLSSLILSSLIMGILLYHTPKVLFHAAEGVFSFGEALRYGAFQAVSSHTSTGFAFANYDLWPASAQVFLLILMFVGGMSGSTAGGIKIIRHLISLRVIKHKIELIFRPTTVRCLKIGSREITDNTAITVLVFLAILFMVAVIGTFLLVIDGVDSSTAMGLAAAMVNNGGLTFNAAGPAESCAFLSPFSKIVSIVCMALGRLEFFVLLVLLVPAFWKGR
jgi:trk system potassium uptake protein TrkH